MDGPEFDGHLVDYDELADRLTTYRAQGRGGKGIITGPANYLAHAYQALPISITVEGANILTRSLIIFGQGVIRAHPWMLKEIEATGTFGWHHIVPHWMIYAVYIPVTLWVVIAAAAFGSATVLGKLLLGLLTKCI